MKKKIFYLILSLITLPIIIFVAKQVQRLLSRAAYQPANIVIDTKSTIGPVNRVWSCFSQGGEEPPPMLAVTVEKMRQLSPRFIRLDHVYDSYSVVQKEGDGFRYDFSRLDETVNDILTMGALPFFSLSYMPSVFTSSGSLIDPPSDWMWWKDLVKATVEHYSGKDKKNLNNLYYEVWNEPELPQFGSWKISPEKDYRLLYFHAAAGAREAQNINNFYLGGPGLGSYYPNWIRGLLTYVAQNNLKFDFYSWHRYTKKPEEYAKDAQNTRKIISSFPSYANIPIFLTEWGIESENTVINNSNTAASYTVSAISQFKNIIDLAFVFEVKDGPPPNGGKWGLLTHEKDQNPLTEKPRYRVFSALNKLKGEKLSVEGEGTFVKTISSRESGKITAIIGNYDLSGKNTENVPVTFKNLSSSSYKVLYTYLLENITGTNETFAVNGIISKNYPLSAGSVLILELTPKSDKKTPVFSSAIPTAVSESQTYSPKKIPFLTISPVPQTTASSPDQATVFRSPEFRLEPAGSISFDLKILFDQDNRFSFNIFEAPFTTTNRKEGKLILAKEAADQGNFLTFKVLKEREETSVKIPINAWQKNRLYRIEASWNLTNISFSAGEKYEEKAVLVNIDKGSTLTFFPFLGAISNLKVTAAGKELIRR